MSLVFKLYEYMYYIFYQASIRCSYLSLYLFYIFRNTSITNSDNLMSSLNPRPLLHLLLFILISAVIILLICKTIDAKSKKELVAAKVAQWPSKLPFQALRSFNFPSPRQASIIFYFHPECDHCIYEAKAIQKHLDAFRSVQMIWISAADSSSIRHFAQEQQLDKQPNVQWMSDTADVFHHTFGSSSVPSVWIYGKAGQLLKHYQGETKPSALLKYLNNESETGR